MKLFFMMSKGRIILFVIYFTTITIGVKSNKLTNLQTAIDKLVECERISDNLTKIIIKSQSYVIFHHDPKYGEKTGVDNFSKSTKFYSCINCEFANWTQLELYKIIETVPLLHHKIFINKYSAFFGTFFQNTVRVFDEAEKYNDRFTRILFNFISVYSYSSLLDTSVLKILVSLRFKINLIRPNYERFLRESRDNVYKIIIVRMLETINELQKFKALNCDLSSFRYDNKAFYGYSMSARSTNEIDIDSFLEHIGPTELETSGAPCGVNQMTLKNLIDSTNVSTDEILNASVSLTHGDVRMKDVVEHVINSDNLEIILWYQSIVVDAIVRLIFGKIYDVLLSNDSVLDANVTAKLRELKFIFSHYANVSKDAIDCFRLTSSYANATNEERNKLRNMLNVYLTPDEDRIYVVNDRTALPNFRINIKRDDASKTNLIEFLDGIIENVEDYKCFVKSYELFNNEYKRYYIPHSTEPENVYFLVSKKICNERSNRYYDSAYGQRDRPDKRIKLSHQTSASTSNTPLYPNKSYPIYINYVSIYENEQKIEIVRNLYYLCFETFIVLGDTLNNNDPDTSVVQNMEEIAKNLRSIHQYLYSLSNNYDEDKSLNKITYNLLPVLGNVIEHLRSQGTYDEIIRLLHVFITEFNGYGLLNCKLKSCNYLLFNDIDFGFCGLHSLVRNDFDKFIETNRFRYNDDNNRPPLFKEIDERFAGKSEKFHAYDSRIMLYWKGEKLNIGDIIHSLHNAISHPSYAYAMLDIYLKFFIAVFYYETLMLLKCMQNHLNDSIIPKIIEMVTISKGLFPKKFHSIIDYCNAYFKEFLGECLGEKNTSESISYEKKLFNEFEILGIFVDSNVSELPPVCTGVLAFSLTISNSIKSNFFDSFVIFVGDLSDSVRFIVSFIERYTLYYNGKQTEMEI